METTHANCPRCGGSWSKTDKREECSQCSMRYDSSILVLPNFLGVTGRHLGWFPENSSENHAHAHCFYGTIHEIIANKGGVILPIQPFDITQIN